MSRQTAMITMTGNETNESARTLSVIVPARNAESSLPSLLDDLLSLEKPAGWDIEIVVSYTESSDDTLRFIELRPVVLAHCKRIGPSAARNAGAAMAKGDLFYFIDADARPIGEDFFYRLTQTAERLQSNDKFGGFGGPILLDNSQRLNPIAQADHFACWFNWTEVRKSDVTSLFQPTLSLAMTRMVFESMDGFDENIRVLEDFDFHQRAIEAGFEFYYEQGFRVTHLARDTLRKSWRHSWYWGAPYKAAYFSKVDAPEFRIPLESKWFWLNLPGIFTGRMRLVLRSARRLSLARTLVTLPFIAATVLSWSIAAVFGNGQPPSDKPHAD